MPSRTAFLNRFSPEFFSSTRALGFKVFGVDTSPLDINSRYEVIAHNVPCEIDGVTINPGDLIVADIDGVILLPI